MIIRNYCNNINELLISVIKIDCAFGPFTFVCREYCIPCFPAFPLLTLTVFIFNHFQIKIACSALHLLVACS